MQMNNFMKGTLSEKRVAVFVDGFNVYHFLDKTPGYKKYKWLNYQKLAETKFANDIIGETNKSKSTTIIYPNDNFDSYYF